MLQGCPSQSNGKVREVMKTASPSGDVVAQIVEIERGPESSNTQVILSFDGGRCGSGAVSTNGIRVGLSTRWVDDRTLEVTYPKGRAMERNASGEILQCRDRMVRVLLVSQP